MSKITTKEIKYLKDHFKTWTLTDKCHQALEHILARVVSVKILENDEDIFLDWKKGTLIIKLQGDNDWNGDPEAVWAIFGPPREGVSESADPIDALHEELLIVKPEDDLERLHYPSFMYEHFIEEEEEDAADRFLEFCDLGQNCAVIDTENLNSLKEPKICFWSHGSSLEDTDIYSDQDVDSYNYGGFILRVWAQLVYSDDKTETAKLYSEYNLG